MNETFTDQVEADIAALFNSDDANDTVVALAKTYLQARRMKEDAEIFAKTQAAILQTAEEELLRAMDAAGVKSIKIDHEGKTHGISKTSTTYYSMPAGSLDNSEFYSWFVESGGGDLVKSSVHHMSFSAFCKELVESPLNGVTLHPLVKVAERRGVMLRKG